MSKGCYQCEDRVVGCQITCKKYAEFAAERERIREARRKDANYRDYVRDKDTKWIRRNGLR